MSIPPSEPQIPSEHSTPSEVLTPPNKPSEHSISLLTELPLLVLRGILGHIHQPSDLCSVCLVSRDLYHLAVPLLYANLKFYAKYDRFGPRLLDGLLLPKHSQRWGKWVRSFEVCGTPSGTPGGGTLTTGESHTICMVLALVLGKIEVGRLRKFNWSCTTSLRPHEIVIDALLKHKTIQSLEVNLAGGWEWHTQLIAGITDYCKHITDLRLWGISTGEQMSEIAKAIKHMDLKCLGLTISDLASWDDDDTPNWKVLPQLKGNTSQLVWIKLSGFDLTDDPEKLLGTFFNPSTLRQLSLRNYGDFTELLRLLSPHPDTANLEVLKLGYHCSEPQSVELLIRILDKCRNLRVIVLSSNHFTREKLKLLMQAITKSKETLETVVLSLTDDDTGPVIFEKETMIPFKSFVRLQELGIDLEVDLSCGLAYLASVLPRTIRIIDMRYLSSESIDMHELQGYRFLELMLERFATSFYEIHDGLACPELIVFGDTDNYLGLRFFVANPLDPDWTFQQYIDGREQVIGVGKVDQEDARKLAGDSELFDFRY